MPTAIRVRPTPYKKVLLKRREELVRELRGENNVLAASVQSPDAVEFAVKTMEQDVAAATTEMRNRELREIEGALQRVESGTYGECEACGEEINPNRLKAIPSARFCLTCQDLHSRN
jgi:RNA polymerase-binding protein DksA